MGVERVAHYELGEKLGEGGMGVVYRARDTRLGRSVALKFVKAQFSQRWEREARAIAALNHPHIATLYDVGEHEGAPYLAMEFVKGAPLKGPMPAKEAIAYGIQIADALGAAHAAGIVHRDLKPANILATEKGSVKVLDFGLAKLTEGGEAASTQTTAMAGTPGYLAPEQLEGKAADARSDIFAFGCILYELLSGRRAFPGDTMAAALAATALTEPKPLEGAPQELEKLIRRCLRKDPERRPQHIEDLRVALEDLREAPAWGSPPAVSTEAAPGRRAWLVAALAAVAAGGGLSWWLARPHAGGGPPTELAAVQVTTAPGLAIGSSFSPDGTSIAFSSNRSGQFEIYLRPAGQAGAERQITSDGKQNTEPAWSPDGKWIAYHSVARHGIWMAPASGGTPQRLAPFGSSPSWSPDGRQIAFRSLEAASFAWWDWAGLGDSTIWTVGADGSQLRQLTTPRHPPGQHADPSWSPDGRRLVFTGLGASGLWTIDSASGELRKVPDGRLSRRSHPVFAPDGKGVYFTASSSVGGPGVFYVALSGDGQPVQLCRTRQSVPWRVAISRDGRTMAYTRLSVISQIWRTGTEAEGPRPLYQDSVTRAKIPDFSPDGKRLAYIVQAEGSSQALWTMNADGSNPAAVLADAGDVIAAEWAMDGASILCAYTQGGKSEILRVNPADGSRQAVADTGAMLHPHVTPDGREIIWDEGTPPNIWSRPLAGGRARQLTFDREGASFAKPSRDGQWIVYEVQRGDSTQVAAMDRNGGQQSILTTAAGQHFSSTFASDNRRIAYASFEDGVWNICWIDRVTGERKQLTHYTAFGSFVRSPAWRPGTEQMAYEYAEVRGNIDLVRLPGGGR